MDSFKVSKPTATSKADAITIAIRTAKSLKISLTLEKFILFLNF
jgi:hypothetical protein